MTIAGLSKPNPATPGDLPARQVPEETAFTTVVRLSGAGQSPDTEDGTGWL